MLKINEKISSCGSGDAMVAYIYGEMLPAERSAFEDHLLDCTACTDDFAGVADSRYAVYEWQKLEFAPMQTPRFVIPYAVVEARPGWFETLKGVFATGPRLAAAGAFGLLIAVFGASAIFDSGEGVEVADVAPPASVQYAADIPASEPDRTISVPVTGSSLVAKEDGAAKPVQAASKRSDVTRKQSASPVRPNAVAVRRQNTTTKTQAKAPRLNDFEDLSDDSLRLTDLVADIDTRD